MIVDFEKQNCSLFLMLYCDMMRLKILTILKSGEANVRERKKTIYKRKNKRA